MTTCILRECPIRVWIFIRSSHHLRSSGITSEQGYGLQLDGDIGVGSVYGIAQAIDAGIGWSCQDGRSGRVEDGPDVGAISLVKGYGFSIQA